MKLALQMFQGCLVLGDFIQDMLLLISQQLQDLINM